MPTPAYFLNEYGRCIKPGQDGCICCNHQHPQHQGWLGKMCRYWVPMGAESWQELMTQARSQRPSNIRINGLADALAVVVKRRTK